MHKWAFRPLVPEDMPWMERCRSADAHPFTALSAVSLVCWADTFGLSVAGDEDFFVIRSRYDKGYYVPVGDPEKCAAFMAEAAEKEQPARFVYVAEAEAKALAARGWNMLYRADLSEYILSTAALSMEPGTFITESFRTKCRKFARNFEGYQVTPVTAENRNRLWEIAESYRGAQETLPADQGVLEFELEHYDMLKFRGMILTVPDGREAFILGYENTPDMFTMTMTRHDPALQDEITAVCIHEFAKLLRHQYPRINVEEDMGMDGLRRAKILLSPVDLMKVYEVLG